MKSIKLLAMAFAITLFAAACSSKTETSTPTSPEDEVVPGVGAAPDSSQSIDDSLKRQADTTSMRRQ